MLSARPSVAIIGAGMCGLSAAQLLKDHAELTIFEKSRGVGGRMSTRRMDGFAFDHGASFFSAFSPDFKSFLAQSGTRARRWEPVLSQRPAQNYQELLVAAPAMNALVKTMLGDIRLHTATEISPDLYRQNHKWILLDRHRKRLGEFDWLLCTAPSVQTLRLLHDYLPDRLSLRRAVMKPVHALMLGLPGQWEKPWTLAVPISSLIDRVMLDSSKPGRDAGMVSLTVQTNEGWSAARLEAEPSALADEIAAELRRVLDVDSSQAVCRSVHRWRYALADAANPGAMQIDHSIGLAAGGDWSKGNSVEDAWLAGRELAATMISHF